MSEPKQPHIVESWRPAQALRRIKAIYVAWAVIGAGALIAWLVFGAKWALSTFAFEIVPLVLGLSGWETTRREKRPFSLEVRVPTAVPEAREQAEAALRKLPLVRPLEIQGDTLRARTRDHTITARTRPFGESTFVHVEATLNAFRVFDRGKSEVLVQQVADELEPARRLAVVPVGPR